MASLGTTFNRQMFTVEGSAVRLGAAASAASGRAIPAKLAQRRSHHAGRFRLRRGAGPGLHPGEQEEQPYGPVGITFN